jgi:hypothetical protein
MTHEPECPQNQPGDINAAVCACPSLLAAYRRGFNDHARSVQHWQDTHGAYRQTEVVTHQCPPDGSGVMPCCGVTPFERMGGRMTLDPALVTCTGDRR